MFKLKVLYKVSAVYGGQGSQQVLSPLSEEYSIIYGNINFIKSERSLKEQNSNENFELVLLLLIVANNKFEICFRNSKL